MITKHPELRRSVLKYAQLRLCPPYFGQLLAMACYQNDSDYIESARENYRQRREVLYNGLLAIPGVRSYKPLAAFYNIAELPVDDAMTFCKWMLSEFNVDGKTVMLAPADGFYHNQELGKKQVRIAYVLNSQDLNEALNILQLGIEAYTKVVV